VRGRRAWVVLFALLVPSAGAAAPVKVVVSERFTIEAGGRRLLVPYMSNVPLDKANERIHRAVIVIHGLGRNADAYFESVMQAAGQTAAGDRTVVVAPQFLINEDAKTHTLGPDCPCWREGGWEQGDGAAARDGWSEEARISSFLVVDRLIEKLTDGAVFPKLRRVVVAGHSAGGQFVNRYAAGNPLDEKLGQDRGVRFRYIVSNPSSYLYFNEERPVLDSPGQFAKPSDEQPGGKGCGSYNAYRYGLEKLNPYMQAVGAEKLGAQYAGREVIYLLGGADTNPGDPLLSKTCAAMMQGRNRLERGQLYHHYLRHFFGAEIAKRHRIELVPGVGHDARKMFNSPVGVQCLFESPARNAKQT
jgi:hypothetical protein